MVSHNPIRVRSKLNSIVTEHFDRATSIPDVEHAHMMPISFDHWTRNYEVLRVVGVGLGSM